MMIGWLCFLGVLLGMGVSMAAEQASAHISYTVSFSDAPRHLVEIEAVFPSQGRPHVDVMLPVWTPGSYLVREYARNVESISAAGSASGDPLSIERLDKHRWRVVTGGEASVRVRYRLYARELSVRTNWVEADFAFLTGAATFLTLDQAPELPHHVRILPDARWPNIATSLAQVGPDPWTRVAKNYDELVDSPLVIGDLDVRRFDVGGKPHYLVTLGSDGLWDTDRAAKDVAAIVEHQQRFWGEIPYEHYWFLNLLTESGGGLEHDNSCVLMSSRFAMRSRERYLNWLRLVSHEFFHTWNVRRLRPVELMRYDYSREQYFPELWVAEGITSYYDDLLVRRSQLYDQAEYLKGLSKLLAGLQATPGRLQQSLYDSSWDTWIKLYRPDENAHNSRISYYVKGAALAWVLDARLRQISDGRHSLDDLMRRLWDERLEVGYQLADIYQLVTELADAESASWLEQQVNQAAELDYQPALDYWGLRFKPSEGPKPDSDSVPSQFPADDKPPVDIGLEAESQAGKWVVRKLIRGRAAEQVGLQVGDELIGLNGYRTTADNWTSLLSYFRPGERVQLTLSRRGRLMQLDVPLEAPLMPSWQLEVDPDASSTQQLRLRTWLQLPEPIEEP
jgi:predicted metalloprotease with PDZ domain